MAPHAGKERAVGMERDLTLASARKLLPRWDGPLAHPFYSKVLKRAWTLHWRSFFSFPALW